MGLKSERLINSSTQSIVLATFKLVVGDKNGKAVSYEVKDDKAKPLIGLRIGDTFDATLIGLPGKIKITGGSDKSGVPMRADVHGAVKKYVLLTKGTNLRNATKGERLRKLVRGNVISDDIYQINAVLLDAVNVGKEGMSETEAKTS
jgi:small subunit ribosomal protein S6e